MSISFIKNDGNKYLSYSQLEVGVMYSIHTSGRAVAYGDSYGICLTNGFVVLESARLRPNYISEDFIKENELTFVKLPKGDAINIVQD